MKTHDVQSVSINVPAEKAFKFIAEPKNLPKWTNAFAEADARKALLRTPQGSVDIKLRTNTHSKAGTVDWDLIFPDGTVGTAFSRVTPDGEEKCIYSFVLMAPPVPLEALEGALQEQMALLAEELVSVKGILEQA